jgi:apolipoprotein D and lipocalin family protein
MARTPEIPAADFQELRDRVAREGYDMTQLATVPQEWPERANAPPRSAEEECS